MAVEKRSFGGSFAFSYPKEGMKNRFNAGQGKSGHAKTAVLRRLSVFFESVLSIMRRSREAVPQTSQHSSHTRRSHADSDSPNPRRPESSRR